MNKTILFVIPVFLLWACGNEKTAGPSKNNRSIAAVTDTVPKKDTTAKLLIPYDSDTFIIQKTYWARDLDPKSFLQSQEVDDLIRKYQENLVKPEAPLSWDFEYIDEPTLKKLSPKDILYYALAYPGSFSQNCNAFAIETDPPRFYPYIPNEGYQLSPLQKKFIMQQKDTICALLYAHLTDQKVIDYSVLQLMIDTQLYDMIPLVCEKANFSDNLFCYTALMQLMEKEKYGHFYASKYYDQLYGANATSAYEGLKVTQADAKALKEIAMKFHLTKK